MTIDDKPAMNTDFDHWNNGIKIERVPTHHQITWRFLQTTPNSFKRNNDSSMII
jgi:hypothetical protein